MSNRINFKLFISGQTNKNSDTVSSIKEFFDLQFNDNYELEVVNILDNPTMAEDCNIIATPTLVKYHPAPTKMVIGDLTNKQKIMLYLDLQ